MRGVVAPVPLAAMSYAWSAEFERDTADGAETVVVSDLDAAAFGRLVAEPCARFVALRIEAVELLPTMPADEPILIRDLGDEQAAAFKAAHPAGIDRAWLIEAVRVWREDTVGRARTMRLTMGYGHDLSVVIGRVESVRVVPSDEELKAEWWAGVPQGEIDAASWLVGDLVVTNEDAAQRIMRGELPSRSPEFVPETGLVYGLCLTNGTPGYFESEWRDLIPSGTPAERGLYVAAADRNRLVRGMALQGTPLVCAQLARAQSEEPGMTIEELAEKLGEALSRIESLEKAKESDPTPPAEAKGEDKNDEPVDEQPIDAPAAKGEDGMDGEKPEDKSTSDAAARAAASVSAASDRRIAELERKVREQQGYIDAQAETAWLDAASDEIAERGVMVKADARAKLEAVKGKDARRAVHAAMLDMMPALPARAAADPAGAPTSDPKAMVRARADELIAKSDGKLSLIQAMSKAQSQIVHEPAYQRAVAAAAAKRDGTAYGQ